MSQESKKEAWEEFLVDSDEAAKENPENFIKPNIEAKLPAHKRKECREIVLEVKKFGVSQRQMLYLIYLLALELEDIGAMKAIVKAVGEHRENVPINAVDLTSTEQPKIILE